MLNSNDASPATHFYAGDQVGTAQMELSGVGTPVWKGEFTPFGLELDTAETANRYKFTGKERDQESGLDYFGARFYGSAIGRFISPDPMLMMEQKLTDPQQWNMYSYARNNPTTVVDGNGKWPTRVHNDIIEAAFPGQQMAPGIRSGLVQILETVSARQDQCVMCQSEGRAYQHYMKRPGESASFARLRAEQYIGERSRAARGITENGDFTSALTPFGEGLHTVLDSKSPAHVDANGMPRTWGYLEDMVEGGFMQHNEGEANPTPQQFRASVQAAQQYFYDTFGADAASAYFHPVAVGGYDLTKGYFTSPSTNNGFLGR